MSPSKQYPVVECCICGEKQKAFYLNKIRDAMVKYNVCFSCLFWREYVARKDEPNIARVKGSHYVICDESPSPQSCRGFGGTKFTIAFHDGRVVTTTNLWHQGTIPERFRVELPDNAVFQ